MNLDRNCRGLSKEVCNKWLVLQRSVSVIAVLLLSAVRSRTTHRCHFYYIYRPRRGALSSQVLPACWFLYSLCQWSLIKGISTNNVYTIPYKYCKVLGFIQPSTVRVPARSRFAASLARNALWDVFDRRIHHHRPSATEKCLPSPPPPTTTHIFIKRHG